MSVRVAPVRRIHKESGFSMIEVLVALLVLAIGLLGVAGVQLLSMQQTANSTLRSEATLYAQTAADRVRANGGDVLDSADLAQLEANMQQVLGADSDLQISVSADVAQITVQWTERDPFSDSGSATQTLTMNASL
ncbi:type IV pilus modification protein PilV [uncultured Marinobacter sp.]|nr:type IV pilus modification protein PilV [uncultured Marinobacter sp.]MCP4064481.1 type IV pilus modification protein PilV [Gammaproteobacteria bacterium]MTI79154.1 type IV pilus modification protein PilV [Marinobacter sp.]